MEQSSELGAQVRDALFLAASRTYAEQYIEPIIRYRFQLDEPDSDDYDALGRDGTRYEIKACKVMMQTKNGKTSKVLFSRVMFELQNLPYRRAVPYEDRLVARYDANVQNVKRDHFDELIYVLLFQDILKVFSLESSKILGGHLPGWSDKHGRYDALGKSGQFGIKRTNIDWHEQNALKASLSYDEAAKILQKLSG